MPVSSSSQAQHTEPPPGKPQKNEGPLVACQLQVASGPADPGPPNVTKHSAVLMDSQMIVYGGATWNSAVSQVAGARLLCSSACNLQVFVQKRLVDWR